MPPKTRGSSSGPAGAKARGTSKGAAKAKAKANVGASSAHVDPRIELDNEAIEKFESYQPEGNRDGMIKLAQFAEIIRAMNRKKCMLWGDDPGPIIKREWTRVDGFQKREIALADFIAWWPAFAEATNAEHTVKLAADEEAKLATMQAREGKYGHAGVWEINLKDIIEAMRAARAIGKTPLIIDNTPDQRAEAFFAYSGDTHIIECKKMIVDKAKGSSAEEVLEGERARFFRGLCFKYGKTVVFRLANTACDLKGAFNSEVFPSVALMNANEVLKCIGPENAANIKDSPFGAMPPDEDERLELFACGINENFNVVVVTQFAVEDYEGFLKDMLPLELLQPVSVRVD